MLRKTLFVLFVTLLLSACSMSPGIYLDDKQMVSSPEMPEKMPVQVVPISPGLIKQQYQRSQSGFGGSSETVGVADYQYLIGPQDVLSITVWEHPELTIPAGGQRPVEQEGNQVRADGTIFYPYVGLLHVAGKTNEQVRRELTGKLSRYIKNPQLDVRVVGFNSKRVHVAGAVNKPGVIPLTDVPLTLGDVITISGGVGDTADTQDVVLTREGVKYSYNLQNLFYKGDLSQNILLKDKDIIYVPVNKYRKVYVMGEVDNSAAISMPDGELNLAEVLTSAGVDQNAADPEKIFVLRNSDKGATAYQLDASEPGALILATTFSLKPLDVVFVSTAELTRWNRVLSQLMPTVETLWALDRYNSGN